MKLIKNGYIKPIEGEDIENGQILIDGNKIIRIAKEIKIDESEVSIIDAKGYIVTPGLIEGHCHLGLWEEGIGTEGRDGNEIGDPITPHMRAVDGINPMCQSFDEALKSGVTSAVTGPGSGNVIGGQFVAIKLFGDRVDNMIIKDPVAMKFAFGENPKRNYSALNKAPNTRLGIAALMRETLNKAIEYNRQKEASINNLNKAPKYDIKMESLIPLIKKEIPMKAHAHRADDIFTALRIAKEFDLDITLDHCTEGHLIVNELVKENKPVLIGPTLLPRSKYETRNLTFETPKVLADAGIKICIITDSNIIPLEYLSLCAGLAVKSGLDEKTAWEAITINPAVIAGIDDRVGSLKEGKDADIVIFKGNPLTNINYKTMVTIIDGEIVYKDPDFITI